MVSKEPIHGSVARDADWKDARKVKAKLWQFGYSVRDFWEYGAINFDLMVDGKFRVIVTTNKKIDQMPIGSDVIALVDSKQKRIVFMVEQKGILVKYESTYDVFGKPISGRNNL